MHKILDRRDHHDGVSPVPTVSSRRIRQRQRQRQRQSHRRPVFVFFLYTLLLLLLQATSLSGQVEEHNHSDLEHMTEAELEDICIKRGFQLVNDDIDPDTGEVFTLTKQDYIEAAQRCLAIEKEMNELLTQYPELADELDEEMKRLEEENAEKQAVVEKLENQIGSNNAKKTVDSGDSSSNNSSNSNGDKAVDGTSNMAFTRGKNMNSKDSNEEPTDDIVMPGEVPINESVDDDYPSAIIDDADVQDDSTSSTTSYNNPDTRDNRIEEDPNNNTYMATHDDDDDDEDDDDDTIETGMESLSDETLSATTADKEDFAISHLAADILHAFYNAKDSVKQNFAVVKVILQPVLDIGDVAWRQIKSLFEKVRKRYKEATNQSSSSPNKKMEEFGEPTICDDSHSNSA